ncbi:MAG: LD-carboxypeptidase [Deltaproteobacteria bacterium]|jgi:muramoyltetrapeptide carboxypeptidase|nr:LD-carboxypeptidase [Deltaproteobacteria bacterium]
MKKEYFLKKGGTIGICAPSARFDLQKFNAGVKILKGLGYKVKIPKEIFEKKRYLAGNDILRADVINQLFSDPDIDGIICARGGFGAMRLLDHLNWDLINKNPKLFIGFSDITAILLSIMEKTDKAVIHGPTVVSIAKAQHKTIESFQRTIQGCFDEIKIANGRVLKPGKSRGIFKGGNISTISHLLGTRFQPGFKNAVLFLEDIGEPAYKIDRMLSQLKMAGIFKGIAGVITGSFEKCDNSEYIEEILLEIFQEYNIPIVTGLDAGHGNINLSLSMGINIEIDTKTLTINWN